MTNDDRRVGPTPRFGCWTRNATRALQASRRALPRSPFGRVVLAGAVVVIVIPGCKGSEPAAPAPVKTLPLVAFYPLDVPEPSDLAIDETGKILWTVISTPGPDSVVQLDLTGKRVKTLKHAGEDLEGVAYDPSNQTLWVAEENKRRIVHLDLDGNVKSKHDLYLSGEQNSGLEGICLNDGQDMFLLNEKRPGLFIELNTNHSIAAMDTLAFAADYSGISYDPSSACFWIVSDQSRRLYLWSKTAGIIKEYGLPFPKAEGVAFDRTTNLIYIVSDTERRLYVYQYAP